MLDMSVRDIDALDSYTLSRDPMLRRQILPTLRRFFVHTYKDFDASMDDAALLTFSAAKYAKRTFRMPTSDEDIAAAEEALRVFVCLYHIPEHVCVWFKRARKAGV